MITASNSMEYAFEGTTLADEHDVVPSVFTAAPVEGLATGDADRDEDGWVSLGELYEYLFERVRERNPNQTPGRDIEMLYLARSKRRRIKPLPVPADLQAAIVDANMFTRLGAVAELRARLASDNLQVAAGAFEALTHLATPTSATSPTPRPKHGKTRSSAPPRKRSTSDRSARARTCGGQFDSWDRRSPGRAPSRHPTPGFC